MSQAIVTSIAAAIGTDHVRTDVGGRVIATPPSIEALAHLLGIAYDGSWSVAIAGNGSWQVNDAPAMITISLRALDQVVEFDPTPTGYIAAQGGTSLETIRQHVANRPRFPHGLTIEPPGRSDRTVGSVVATGTLGALRAGFGQLVDELRGLVVVTGDGRIVRV
ncbi:MAG: FAD-binding protein, partial [bacterium]